MEWNMSADDTLGAFVAPGRIELKRRDDGPLAGLSFALKDLFDVAGLPTGAGNPDWLATHPAAAANAPLLDLLLDAGASLVGKTLTDELAWSITGENAHYGTPINPAAPGRIPGGSSSGSAAATAGGLVDFAIGTDTGGSVRLPASFCGLYGARPTHGLISLAGAVALAPSYDVAGWFARDAGTFARVGTVLLGEGQAASGSKRALIAGDFFDALAPDVAAALAPAVERVTSRFGGAERVSVAGRQRAEWRDVFRVLQASEAWATHGDWIRARRPTFGPGVRERFAAAAVLDASEVAAALVRRAAIREQMDALLGDDAVLILPTTPGIAPLRGRPETELAAFRATALEFLCPAGHAGLPQVSLPLATLENCPLGLSVMAPRGHDHWLFRLALEIGG
jgi:amidase